MIKKIIKRAVEVLTKSYFLNLVRSAYLSNAGLQHQRIQRESRIWFGIGPKVSSLRKHWSQWQVDFTLQARNDLFKRGECHYILKDAEIGFENLMIHCSSTDSNSTFVYLLGFTDNIVSFELLRKYVLPGTIAIDVGANLGVHSMALAKCVGEGGKVIAFEPLGAIYQRLVGNIRLNSLVNIETRKVGISAKSGMAKFDANSQDFNIGKGLLSDNGDMEVTVSTIDDELKNIAGRVSFIKIDIEGGELDALKGAREILGQHKPVVMLEFNPADYSLSDLQSAIPFKARYWAIPATFADHGFEISDTLRETRDVLVIPEN